MKDKKLIFLNNCFYIVANNLMRLHGGRIGIFSAGEGKGSTFVIDIPILKIEYVIPDVPSQELIVSQIHSEEKVTPVRIFY